jgi:hypothetical protein
MNWRWLLKAVPPDFSEFEVQTPETYLMLEAAVTHAINANTALMSGLESLACFSLPQQTTALEWTKVILETLAA